MEAAENNHLETVKYLIKAGALVDPKVVIYSLPFSPEEASVQHFFLKFWVEVPRLRRNGLVCLGVKAGGVIISFFCCLGQVLPLVPFACGTKCQGDLIS